MTKFESRGVELQQESLSGSQAETRFGYSCSLCCKLGMRIECDRCAINVVHNHVMKVFRNEKVSAAVSFA